MDNRTEQQNKSCRLKSVDSNLVVLSDNEWTVEATIDELQRNLATAEQTVTNKAGQNLVIKRYQTQCRPLARYIPIALPTPEYLVYSSDLKPEVRQSLDNLSHPRIRDIILR